MPGDHPTHPDARKSGGGVNEKIDPTDHANQTDDRLSYEVDCLRRERLAL